MNQASETALVNALSIDVEDYFQVSAFEQVIPKSEWDNWPSRVEKATHRLLDLFDEANIRATFFSLGWIADRFPQLIRRFVDDGHEVACHGYDHVRLTNHTPESLREDLQRSKQVLEDVSGTRIAGYRAASFSINAQNTWTFSEIEQAGFRYSSSVYPVRHDLYGIPDAPRIPYRPPGTTSLIEIPIVTARYLGMNIPAGGGGYFRLFPYALSRALLRSGIRQGIGVGNMYFHPWEFDPEQPRPTGISTKTRFRHYINQDRALPRLRRLLSEFRWAPFRVAYGEYIA